MINIENKLAKALTASFVGFIGLAVVATVLVLILNTTFGFLILGIVSIAASIFSFKKWGDDETVVTISGMAFLMGIFLILGHFLI